MPELPEVETIKRGLADSMIGRTILSVKIRQYKLRWPIDPHLEHKITGEKVIALRRRGKYLVTDLKKGHLIIHLGMSGTLRVFDDSTAIGKHDHLDIHLDSRKIIRFCDPRRFGAILFTVEPAEFHPLLAHLGIEPLQPDFNGETLFSITKTKKTSIKQLLMNSHLIAGIGNIYANEALFYAGIHPAAISASLDQKRCSSLADSISATLMKAINLGGSSLRDFVSSDGKKGYFQQEYQVYGRNKQLCHTCKTSIIMIRQNGRSSFFCPRCQPF
ncbi:MAG: bifunctional DNA-formamidopyrimidine glycosylase/DNA-(apurinic or apyrimidinic site) lyase [Proteobacteria bacterium]|nr:bifunctional DNA-formamidopyrimidine glycosylase/DNA-(apurinic or apyrimidinic site) lyase [Pseudomonadota bacterium]